MNTSTRWFPALALVLAGTVCAQGAIGTASELALARTDAALAAWARGYAGLPGTLPVCAAISDVHPEYSDVALTCLHVAFEDGSTLNLTGLVASFTPWINGARNGTAIFLYRDGSMAELPFVNNELHGTLVRRPPNSAVVETCYQNHEELHNGRC